MGWFRRTTNTPGDEDQVSSPDSTRYRLVITYPDGTVEEDEDLFDTYEQADAAGLDAMSSYRLGGEILHDSNPGDHPLTDDEPDFHIIGFNDWPPKSPPGVLCCAAEDSRHGYR